MDRTLVNVADEDGGEDDVAERGRCGFNARHGVCVGILQRILSQKVERGRDNCYLEKE
jgi:hypothetical protein